MCSDTCLPRALINARCILPPVPLSLPTTSDTCNPATTRMSLALRSPNGVACELVRAVLALGPLPKLLIILHLGLISLLEPLALLVVVSLLRHSSSHIRPINLFLLATQQTLIKVRHLDPGQHKLGMKLLLQQTRVCSFYLCISLLMFGFRSFSICPGGFPTAKPRY